MIVTGGIILLINNYGSSSLRTSFLELTVTSNMAILLNASTHTYIPSEM